MDIKRAMKRALELYEEDGLIEIDESQTLKYTDGGVFVQALVFVGYDDLHDGDDVYEDSGDT